MSPEQSFYQYRLTQLSEQFLSETSISGEIIFFADDEGRISGATWRFNEEDQRLLKGSDFKFMLMELLDILIQYRASLGNTDTLNGIVHMEESSPDIQWLTTGEAEKRRALT